MMAYCFWNESILFIFQSGGFLHIQIYNILMEERNRKPQLGGHKHPSPFSKSYKPAQNEQVRVQRQRAQEPQNNIDIQVVSVQESERHGGEYFSLATAAGRSNPMAIDEENSLRASADYNHASNTIKQVEAPQLTITTTSLTRPVPNQQSQSTKNQKAYQPKSSTLAGPAHKLTETSPPAMNRTGSRTSKASGNEYYGHSQNKMLISAALKSGAAPQLPYDRVETLQPKILQNSGPSKGTKKQTSIYVQQRANVPKFKQSKCGAPVFSMNSTKECTFCCGSHPHTVTHAQHSSCFLNSHSSIGKATKPGPVPPKDLIMSNLGRKYGDCHVEFENLKVVNDLIYNEQTHVVSIFKDYLILDDINEFLKRSYKCETESQVRLPKLCEFYQKYSQVFPNFVSLPESKYMFRNIQRKQRLIDEQFNNMQKNGGETGERDSQRKDKASLMHSANKLFSTGFIDSVLNQKPCTSFIEDDWKGKRKEAQERRYVESARRLNKSQRDQTGEVVPFQVENLDLLVQKFLHKDTESTIHLNTSLGNLGDEILGKTFAQEQSMRNSMDAQIGIIDHKSQPDTHDGPDNRMSIIPVQANSFQQSQTSVPTSASKSRTVTSKTGGGSSKAQQIKLSAKRSKAGSGVSQRKSFGQKQPATNTAFSSQQQQQLQKSATATSVKQKVGQLIAQTQLQQPPQPATGKALPHQLSCNILSQPPNAQKQQLPLTREKTKSTPSKEEQKFLREKYLECDIGDGNLDKKVESTSKRLSANVDSASQSPVEGILNPLSSQPLLSKTSMNQKTTQPGSSLGFFKQRSSEVVIGSATPTQHLYHSKQISFKGAGAAANKLLPQLNLISQQAESDYYSSGFRTSLAQQKGNQFLRSQTAMNSVQNSARPTMLASQPPQTKHVSRERSPPLMQETKQVLKKGKKSPHQKKDRRAVTNGKSNEPSQKQLQNGKTSTGSIKSYGKQRSPQHNVNNRIAKQGSSRASLALSGPVNLAPASEALQQAKPLSSQSSNQDAMVQRHKFYSQTEINEADEDYPEDEVADEIPDQNEIEADTEDEQDMLPSDDEEGHINDSKERTLSVRDKLRPVDMLPTHGGAFQEEDSYNMQMISNKPRAQTTMNYHPTNVTTGGKRLLSGQNQYDPALISHQSVQQRQKIGQVAMTSISNYGSERQNPQKSSSQVKPGAFNSTQQPAITQNRRSLQTEIDLRPIQDSQTSTKSGQIKFQQSNKCQLPLSTTYVANRPNTNIVSQQSMSIRSKFSRENSVNSRQDTQPGSKPIYVQDSQQRFYEASMKLGGKALINSQSNAATRLQNTLTTSLRSSIEPAKLIAQPQAVVKVPQSVATSNQASLLAVSRNPANKVSSNSVLKKQHQHAQYKADLSSRLASNLMTEQYLARKKTSNHENLIKQQQTKQQSKMPIQQANNLASAVTIGKPKTTSFVKNMQDAHYANSGPKPGLGSQKMSHRSGNSSTQQQAVKQSWSRKSLNFQSPHAGVTQAQASKKASAETIGKFQAMGSGKASYLTNVGIAATQNTLGTTSRNFTSPYASINQNQRFIPKDSSGGSLPKSKLLSKSPPMSEKESQLMIQQRNLMKTSSQNLSLQQQLQQINKQLALSQVKSGSFRQTAGVSPQSSNSLSKKKTSAAVLTPATSHPSSLLNTQEKVKQRVSSDRATIEVTSTKSLQRSSQQTTLKQSIAAAQALISLPNSKSNQLKSSQNIRSSANNVQKTQKLQNPIIDSKTKSQAKVGNFFGQSRAFKHTSSVLSPQAAQTASTKALTKQVKAVTLASDRSNKSQRGVNPVGSVQINIFQSSTGELRKAITSMEEVKASAAGMASSKGVTSGGNSRMASKKQSISGKQLKKTNNALQGSSKALSLSPQHATGANYSYPERRSKR